MVLHFIFGAISVSGAQTLGVSKTAQSVAPSISLIRVKDLRLPRASGQFSSPFRTVQVWDGSIAVYDPFGNTPLSVFDGVGGYQWSKSISQLTELNAGAISAFLYSSDALLQAFGSAWLSFDQTGKTVASRRMPNGIRASNAVEGAKGQVTFNASSGSASEHGNIFVTAAMDGAQINTFGSAKLYPDSRAFEASWRALCAARSGGMWSIPLNEYRIERWGARGKRMDAFVGDSLGVWWTRWNGMNQRTQPDPRVIDCREDESGRLWVLQLVADKTWVRREFTTRATMPTVTEQVRQLDSVIDVFDVHTRRRVATMRLDGMFVSFLGAGLIAETMEDLNQEVFVRVWSLTLQ